MADSNPFRLPSGLPTHLSQGKDGFKALCELLSIASRQRRQEIVNTNGVKQFLKGSREPLPPKTGTADRLRINLTAFYGDPGERRSLWCHHRSIADGGEEPPPSTVPSLEQEALVRYNSSSLTAVPDAEDLARVSDFYTSELANDEWRRPALATLSQLYHDFAQWHALAPDRKRDLLAAGFAAATLLDDRRLLAWAVGQDEEIAAAYAFVMSKHIPDTTSAPESVQAPSPDENVIERLRASARKLGVAADGLAKQVPTEGLFYEVAEQAQKVLARPIQCAVQRCTILVGANPTRQESFQPVAIGTAVEVTNRSKLLV